MITIRILFVERGNIWRYGLPDGLRDLGHDVRMSAPIRERPLARQMRRYKPDLLIYIGWGHDHTPSKQRLVRKLATRFRIPLVYWSTEDPNFTHEFTIPLLKRMKPDYVFTISAHTVDTFRKMGYAADYMDFGFHPNVHHRVRPIHKYKADIAVVANAYPDVLKRYPKLYRWDAINILIRPLLKEGYRIHFYGRNWPRMMAAMGLNFPKHFIKRPIPYKEANQVYSSSKIMIGLQNYTHMAAQRTYEIVGSGGFLLTCNTPGIRSLLQPGRDAAMSSSPEETLQLVRYYLANPEQREKVIHSGRRTIARHTYTQRARFMLAALKRHGIIRS